MYRAFFLVLLCCACRNAFAEVKIHLEPSIVAGKTIVSLKGLSQAELYSLRSQPHDQLSKFLKFFVCSETLEDQRTLPPMLGEYSIDMDSFDFYPRFVLTPGKRYRAEFRSPIEDDRLTIVEFHLPETSVAMAAKVNGIFPSGPKLPQNLLKFYLHFSAPMEQGNAYRYVDIAFIDGQVLKSPFLEVAEELWDRSGTRLTLLLDPGRIKRGLVPREEDGAILEAGKSYRLTVHSEWPNAQGRPMQDATIKEFTVVEEDFHQPNAEDWILKIADRKIDLSVIDEPDFKKSSSLNLLEVRFPESLDHAMLSHSLEVIDALGNAIPGRVETRDHEQCWRFIPIATMLPGEYTVKINPLLEDLAGNSVSRPFEVDLSKPISVKKPILSLRFTVP